MTSRTPVIAGVGMTDISSRSGRTTLTLAVQAADAAMRDTGLTRADVDGVVTYRMGDSDEASALASALRLPDPSVVVTLDGGGNLACAAVALAAAAVQARLAETVLVYRSLNGRSGVRRLGGAGQPVDASGYRAFSASAGLLTYPQHMAMWCRRHEEVFGSSEEARAQVALRQRAHAVLNPRAQLRDPLELSDYLASPWVVEPFRLLDITPESDGACAVLVTTQERARDLRVPPVRILATAASATAAPGLGIDDDLQAPDMTQNFTWSLRERLFGGAGLVPDDVDFAEIYDCFTHAVLLAIEGLGFADLGEGGDYLRQPDAVSLGGRMPINTHGGLLSEGYLHGLNHVAEAVWQLRGEAGARQVGDAEVGLVTAGAMTQGSALLLARS